MCIRDRYYEAQGRQIEIIRLNGSIELAPILGLSDVIVEMCIRDSVYTV